MVVARVTMETLLCVVAPVVPVRFVVRRYRHSSAYSPGFLEVAHGLFGFVFATLGFEESHGFWDVEILLCLDAGVTIVDSGSVCCFGSATAPASWIMPVIRLQPRCVGRAVRRDPGNLPDPPAWRGRRCFGFEKGTI